MCTLEKNYFLFYILLLFHFLTVALADLVSARALLAPASFFFPTPTSHDSALTSASFHSGHNDAKRDFRFSSVLNRRKET